MSRAFWIFQIVALAYMCPAQLSALAISGNVGVRAAAVKLTGPVTRSTTSNVQGYFEFLILPAGKYVITPSLGGYVFTPASQTVTLTETNDGSVNFTAKSVIITQTGLVASPPSISLTMTGATEQLQVEATYSNESTEVVTASATYASNNDAVATVNQAGLVTAVGNGAAKIVASYGGMASSVSVTVNIPKPTYSISGSAEIGSTALTLAGASSGSTNASSNGSYSFSSLAPGSYTVTPILSGYTFSPLSQAVTITNVSVSGINFTASPVEHLVDLSWGAGTIQNPAPGQIVAGYNIYRSSVSGGPYTKLNSSPVVGLTYTDSAVSAGQILYYVCSTVDNLGNVSNYSNQAVATIP
jgi:hypothetical protein